jgi:Rrf2 family protein
MLTKKTKYALKALTSLAQEYDRGPVLIAELARRERIPRKFLELILLELKNQGILRSKKGKGGGYALGRKPEAISLGHVMRVLDGPLAPLPCVSQSAYQPCEECLDEASCRIRLVMKVVRDATTEILDNTSLADLMRRGDAAPLPLEVIAPGSHRLSAGAVSLALDEPHREDADDET